MIAYIGLFMSALVAATILPMQSEAVLVGLLASSAYSPVLLIGVATVGNVLGSVINWYLGRFLMRFRGRRTDMGDGLCWAVGCPWSVIR